MFVIVLSHAGFRNCETVMPLGSVHKHISVVCVGLFQSPSLLSVAGVWNILYCKKKWGFRHKSSLCCERTEFGVGDFTKKDEPPVVSRVGVALCRILRVLTDLIVYLLCLSHLLSTKGVK